jgi:outer membrane lipopolysaccharide assembly protein LptE/RlpB
MITKQYNPSQLEVEIAEAIKELAPQIEAKLSNCKITVIEDRIKEDNPMLKIKLIDTDEDTHEVVLKIIQKPDAN